MRTKKWLAISLCAIIATASLTGCEKGNKSTDKKQGSEEVFIQDAKSYIKLADYKEITLKTAEIDEELQSEIDEALDQHPKYQTVKKGKVKDGDTVNIYYVGKIDGKAFDGGSCTKKTSPEGYDLEIGSNSFIDGFEEALIGKSIGKTCDINVTFPKEYPQNTDLQGKKAVFTVTINSKQGKKIKQEFNDEFVKENLSDYASAEDYKTKTRSSIISSKAFSKLCDDTKINKYPDDAVKATKKQLRTSIEAYLASSNATLEDYLSNMNMTEEEYEKQISETAKEEVANQLVYNAVAQAEKIEVSKDEYQNELKTYLTNYGCEKEADLNSQFEKNYGATATKIIYNDLLYQKVVDYLIKNVKEA